MWNYKKHLKSYPNARLTPPLQQWLNTSLLIVIAVMLILLVLAIALLVIPEPVFLLVVMCSFLLGVVTGGGMQSYWISLQVTQVLKILHELTTNFLRLPLERYHFPTAGLPLNTVAVLFQLEEDRSNRTEYTVSLSEGEYRHFVQSNGLAISFCSSIEQAYRTSSLSRALLAARTCLPLSRSGSGTAQQQVFVVRHNRASQPASTAAQSIDPPHSSVNSTDNSVYSSIPTFTVSHASPSSPSAASQSFSTDSSLKAPINCSVSSSDPDSVPSSIVGSDISQNEAYNQNNINQNNSSSTASDTSPNPIESAPTVNLTGSQPPLHPKVILFPHIRPDLHDT